MLKVLQVGKFYFEDLYGGIERTMHDIATYINSTKIRCDILCSNIKPKYEESVICNAKVFKTKSYGVFLSTSLTPQIIFKFQKIAPQYDIIHIHHPDPICAIALLLSSYKGKVILHWHSNIVGKKFAMWLFKPIQTYLLKRADKIIASSPKLIDESSCLLPYKEKCIYIPSGVQVLQKRSNKKPLILERCKEKTVIFSLGRLVNYKGHEYLIRSAAYLNDNYLILIAGEGIKKNYLNQIIHDMHLEEKVFLLGKILHDEKFHYYNNCHVFVLPSILPSECFGLVQVEAMSFSKPVITSKIKASGIDWVNKDKVSGINVEPMKPKKIADAIQSITSDSDIYEAYCSRALKRYQDNFTLDKMIRDIKQLYIEVAKG